MGLVQIIALAVVLLTLFGGPLLVAGKAVVAFVAARLPNRPNVSFAGIWEAELRVKWWKVFVVLLGLWVFVGGGGVTLPEWDWKWPTWTVGPSGPQTILIAYEEGKATPAFADLIVDFQNGEAGKPFKAKGHIIYCLDNDTPDLAGQLTTVLKPFAPFDDNKPEVIVSSGGKVTFREPLTYSTSAESLVAILKAKGLP